MFTRKKMVKKAVEVEGGVEMYFHSFFTSATRYM